MQTGVERIEALETMLDAIHARIDMCRQAMILSRVAIGLGLATGAIALTVAPAYNTAPVILAAFTAVIGGVVWLGSNKSTKDDLEARRAVIEAERDGLFDRIAAENGWAADGTRTIH